MDNLPDESKDDRFARLEQEVIFLKQQCIRQVQHIDHLARERRAHFGTIFLMILGAIFTVIIGVGYLIRPAKVIEAEQFILRDKEGHGRAYLFISPKGDPMLAFYDQKKHNLLNIFAGHENSAGMTIFSTSGNALLEIGGSTDANIGVCVFDKTGARRIDLGLAKNEWAGLAVLDRGGRMRTENGLRPDDSTMLKVYSREENSSPAFLSGHSRKP